MIIAMTGFALRQWQDTAGAKRIMGLEPDDLVAMCNEAVNRAAPLVEGYAPFCKHLFLENPSPTRCSFAPVTEANRSFLKSGYMARREGELAVLERWFEGVEAPVARWLDVILYSKAQLDAEAAEGPDSGDSPACDWGIVSIIGTLVPVEPPMPPITQMRNSLGRAEGGSGVPIDRDAYARAVDFWERHASIR
ncbi:hypothetical protein CSC94_08175 [Zhengella mangrovi]|uniref:DUF3228 domain-containing protein n=1 Tax=Zhengella mangrovi TaxID=1982044 RepID=A0A2G1QQB8_9HYPH|nr:DUF3228 family protein [Zhengella mangrovi]PHP67664.1 hypothetical protein CSC94_08175 [Zhengella mangrovi]